MSSFSYGNLFLIISILLGAVSQVLFKLIFNMTGPLTPALFYSPQLLNGRIMVLAALAFAMLVGGFICWTLSLSRLDLSYAYPLACTSILFVAFLGVLFLGETLSAKAIVGMVLVVIGTALIVAQDNTI